MSQPAEMHSRVHKHKFKAKQEEAAVFTLDEWERTKGMKLKPMMTGEKQDTSRDEELARQLQNQLDLENFNASTGHSEAEQIRRSMFSFGGAEERKNDGRDGFCAYNFLHIHCDYYTSAVLKDHGIFLSSSYEEVNISLLAIRYFFAAPHVLRFLHTALQVNGAANNQMAYVICGEWFVEM
ncbi:ADP,ATP carrier protein 1 [Musa troglodytarum]|uniref:ADP,ATP carrier protein 1 n=1 Tax=Musa troglodytarum TaxID=320322 RepID=A0A9E7F0A1_9LILI|nr:ADP,ATP carrier protein 1 [Musa troglodytarum]